MQKSGILLSAVYKLNIRSEIIEKINKKKLIISNNSSILLYKHPNEPVERILEYVIRHISDIYRIEFRYTHKKS